MGIWNCPSVRAATFRWMLSAKTDSIVGSRGSTSGGVAAANIPAREFAMAASVSPNTARVSSGEKGNVVPLPRLDPLRVSAVLVVR